MCGVKGYILYCIILIIHMYMYVWGEGLYTVLYNTDYTQQFLSEETMYM